MSDHEHPYAFGALPYGALLIGTLTVGCIIGYLATGVGAFLNGVPGGILGTVMSYTAERWTP